MAYSETVTKMADLLAEVEQAGMAKYGTVDWARFRKDGRDDNTASILRHVAGASKEYATDSESNLPHGSHAAFRLLMQVIEDEASLS